MKLVNSDSEFEHFLHKFGFETAGWGTLDIDQWPEEVYQIATGQTSSGEKADLDHMSVRDKSALSMIHVFGGLVTNTSSSYSNGKNTVTVNCVDNMEWLKWSRVIGQPALNDPQGLLEDPVTPFDIKTDASGSINFEVTPELLYENKILLKTGLLSYNSGILPIILLYPSFNL